MAEPEAPGRPRGSVSSPDPPAEPLAQPGAPRLRSLRRRPPPAPSERDVGPAPPPRSRGMPRTRTPRRTSSAPRAPPRRRRPRTRRGGGGEGSGLGSVEGERTSAMLSGFVLGPIAFQHVNSAADSGGFLLGEVKGEVKDNITDTQADDVVIVYTIDIRSSIPCSQLFSFYNSSGEVDEQALKKVISCCGKNVIGWYKYRCSSEHKMTRQEMMLHESIQKHLSNQELVFLLLTPTVASESPSTHGMDYLLLHRTQEGVFEKMPLVVTNLVVSEQEEYKTVSGSCTATAYCETVLDHRSEFFDDYGALKEVQKISEFSANMHERLKKMCTQVLNSEHLVERELKDISRLKEEIAAKKRAKNPASGLSGSVMQEEKSTSPACGEQPQRHH